MPKSIYALTLVAIVCFGTKAVQGDVINYGVGNSLTWDLLLAGAFDSTTSGEPNPSSTSYHINCGSSLTATLASPSSICVAPTPLGRFAEAFSAGSPKLDNVFLQPFYGASVRSEIDSVKQLIDLARANPVNTDTRFFVYATWSDRNDGSFLQNWDNTVTSLDAPFVPSRNTYDLVMQTLAAEGYDVGLIAAGHTFAEIARTIQSGETIGGLLTAEDLYRDNIHASNAGKYVAAVSAFSAVYGKDPTGQAIPAGPFSLSGYGTTLTADGATSVQQIAWQTYQSISAVPEPTSGGVLFAATVLTLFMRRSRKLS